MIVQYVYIYKNILKILNNRERSHMVGNKKASDVYLVIIDVLSGICPANKTCLHY